MEKKKESSKPEKRGDTEKSTSRDSLIYSTYYPPLQGAHTATTPFIAIPAWEDAEAKAKEAIEAAMLSFEFGCQGIPPAQGRRVFEKLNKVSEMGKLGPKTRRNLSSIVDKIAEDLIGMWSAADCQLADFKEVESALRDFAIVLEDWI